MNFIDLKNSQTMYKHIKCNMHIFLFNFNIVYIWFYDLIFFH